MSETLETLHDTLEGWYCLHDLRRIDWPKWKAADTAVRQKAIGEATEFFSRCEAVADAPQGSSAIYSILGHKGDLLILHLRETLEELNALELAFEQTLLADYTVRTYSYVSVTELGQYTSGSGPLDPKAAAFIERRLKPPIPDHPYFAFYPMNKKREGQDNWYMLDKETRRRLMHSHGQIGRKFAGTVQQMITGSIGYDDWEWGVTLFATEPLPIKKVVQEMRFDEASARYAEFGPFFCGVRLRTAELTDWLDGKAVGRRVSVEV